MGVTMLGLGAVNVLLVPFVVNQLQVTETWFAALEGSQTLSMVLSGALVAGLASKFKATNIVSVGLGLLGIAIGALSLVTGVWGLMAILFLVGWVMTPLQASLVTLIQTEVVDDLRGRASAALSRSISGCDWIAPSIHYQRPYRYVRRTEFGMGVQGVSCANEGSGSRNRGGSNVGFEVPSTID
jgi:hypothetical protein